MVHQYQLNGYNIVLDTCSGAIHVVDEVAYDIIALYPDHTADEIVTAMMEKYGAREDVTEKDLRDCIDDVEALKQAGKLYTPDTFADMAGTFKERSGDVVKALCLHVAHTCNLSCSYCFASQGRYHGDRALMSFEVGKRAMDFLIENSGTRRNLEVDFFGGEPLMNFDMVKKLVAYCREQEKIHNKNFRFTMTTNGVLIDDDVIDFCNKECHNVVLSLDGRKEVNDRFRKDYAGRGSYDTIVPKFKALVDAAHGCGLRVIIDLVHSHAVKNEVEGLAKFDGTRYAYFHEGSRGEHSGWDSLCFNYAKPEVLHFLLSNCRFYLDEYRVDGFRFDGVTSMMYLHHGLGKTFTGYDDYFGGDVDEDALTYLALANRVIHEVRPDALTVAEDVSGMPGLAAPASGGGIGFDCRMAMGVTDMWFKLFDLPDQDWNMFYLFHELTNRRRDERSISYVESHDQAIVGGKTAIFRLADAAMYDAMHAGSQNLAVDRAIALHKMIRLATAAAAGHGYLNFMGNEFGHPEWIDFPREGNGWSLQHARRQWSLADEPGLRYHFLRDFDRAMLEVLNRNPEFFRRRVQTVRIDDCGKVLIFERDDCYFCFNFHPENSYFDYGFEVLPGEFETVLDSDAPEFGGFSRRAPEQRYWSRQGQSGAFITLYLPSRTALVLKRI